MDLAKANDRFRMITLNNPELERLQSHSVKKKHPTFLL